MRKTFTAVESNKLIDEPNRRVFKIIQTSFREYIWTHKSNHGYLLVNEVPRNNSFQRNFDIQSFMELEGSKLTQNDLWRLRTYRICADQHQEHVSNYNDAHKHVITWGCLDIKWQVTAFRCLGDRWQVITWGCLDIKWQVTTYDCLGDRWQEIT